MPVGEDSVIQATTLDPAFTDGSGDPERKNPAAHTTSPPTYLLSEGKATLQESYLAPERDDFPTEEEMRTLPHVPQKIPWKIFTIAFVELCERMSYYGTIVVYSNFIAKPAPTPTGAALDPSSDEAQPGALGLGKQVAFSLTTFNSFWVYVCPLFGAWIADSYLGRYKTIFYSVLIAEIGHTILVASSAPHVLDKPNTALGVFIVGLLITGFGTGTFKPNISPLIMDQIPQEPLRVEEQNGQRVIVDPAVTATRVYNWFYWFINWGALAGQLGMVFAERYVGFYLAFLIPLLFFMLAIPVLVYCKKVYRLQPASGSVLGPAFKLLIKALGLGVTANPMQTIRNWRNGDGWERIKPSVLGANKPSWYNFDDAWVDEVRRGFGACGVFVWVPIYWLAYRQMDNNLTQMCSTMALHGTPNDLLQNMDPITLIVLVPIFDLYIYPWMRKKKINFTPIKKICAGFIFGSLAMLWAAVLQHYVYKTSGYYDTHDPDYKSPINVWAVTGVYVLVAISEIFASVTTLEYAYTKAPKNMRSLVMGVQCFTTAFSAALAQAFTPLTNDPHLVWNYASVAIIAFATGVLFYIAYYRTDQEEQKLNLLPTGHFGTKEQAADVEKRLSVSAERRASATAAPTTIDEKTA
ncbi:MFS peptide transporter-like protein Ptr2 [Aaosphaeria arxii CBS 175.79]|uniref:MFS peptide transporter-like protein Ptr2 n=1 Tax=Aaosphaeria arxii CBS 175.79 TaxID=1450172 RepID=A0A6A5XJY1_9PLEO|nr:MFS peptide transporter-like protein Ptr2 [Aaosphaeria arxii CBS 175.79]KAF2013588.1 MFS peptide transporter-like protein Ptr2 [Aaosphaeria arxii CBS 175.79]